MDTRWIIFIFLTPWTQSYTDQRFIMTPKVAPWFSLDVSRYLSRRNLVFVENFDQGYLFLREANAIDLVQDVINMHIRLFKRA